MEYMTLHDKESVAPLEDVTRILSTSIASRKNPRDDCSPPVNDSGSRRSIDVVRSAPVGLVRTWSFSGRRRSEVLVDLLRKTFVTLLWFIDRRRGPREGDIVLELFRPKVGADDELTYPDHGGRVKDVPGLGT